MWTVAFSVIGITVSALMIALSLLLPYMEKQPLKTYWGAQLLFGLIYGWSCYALYTKVVTGD